MRYINDTITFKGEIYCKYKYHIKQLNWVIKKGQNTLKQLYKTRDNLENEVSNLKLKNAIYKTKLETINKDLSFILKD